MSTAVSRYTEGEYLSRNPSWHTEDSPWKAKHILRAIEGMRLKPRSICEIGCGAGEILRQLKESFPARYTGYDISPKAIELAQSREGIEFQLGSIPQGNYDLILGIDVIEHIEDCIGFLRELRMKGNSFIFHFPLDMNCFSVFRNIVMINRKSLGHLHYFSKETALATLEDAGYTIESFFYTPTFELWGGFAGALRKYALGVSPEIGQRLLGGYSLMITCY